MLEYETANPEQDDDGEQKAVVAPQAVAAPENIRSNEDVNTRGDNRGYGYDAGPYLEASSPENSRRPD